MNFGYTNSLDLQALDKASGVLIIGVVSSNLLQNHLYRKPKFDILFL